MATVEPSSNCDYDEHKGVAQCVNEEENSGCDFTDQIFHKTIYIKLWNSYRGEGIFCSICPKCIERDTKKREQGFRMRRQVESLASTSMCR